MNLEKRQLIIRQDRTEDKIIRTRRQNKKRFVLMVLICAHADLSRTVQIIRFRPDGIKSSFIMAKFRLNLCQVKIEISLDLHS